MKECFDWRKYMTDYETMIKSLKSQQDQHNIKIDTTELLYIKTIQFYNPWNNHLVINIFDRFEKLIKCQEIYV